MGVSRVAFAVTKVDNSNEITSHSSGEYKNLISLLTDLSTERIVESLNELQTGRFAASGFAHERYCFAAIDPEIQALQHLNILSCRIAEFDTFKFDLAVDGFQFLALLAQTVDRRNAIEKLEDRGRRSPRDREGL